MRALMILFGGILLVVACNSLQPEPIHLSPVMATATPVPSPTYISAPSSVATWTPTGPAIPEPARTSQSTPMPPRPSPTLNYSLLPPLAGLVVGPQYFPNGNSDIPPFILSIHPTGRFDVTSELSERCALDCVKIRWENELGKLSLILIRTDTPQAARDLLVNELEHYQQDYADYHKWFNDPYEGGSDETWSAESFVSTFVYTSIRGPIFLSLLWDFNNQGLDLDAAGCMRELSCLGILQLDILDAALAHNESPVLQLFDECPIAY